MPMNPDIIYLADKTKIDVVYTVRLQCVSTVNWLKQSIEMKFYLHTVNIQICK